MDQRRRDEPTPGVGRAKDGLDPADNNPVAISKAADDLRIRGFSVI
jgi:hypothetical protein